MLKSKLIMLGIQSSLGHTKYSHMAGFRVQVGPLYILFMWWCCVRHPRLLCGWCSPEWLLFHYAT